MVDASLERLHMLRRRRTPSGTHRYHFPCPPNGSPTGHRSDDRLPDNEAGLFRQGDCYRTRTLHTMLANGLTVVSGKLTQPLGGTENKIPPSPGYAD